MDFFELNEYYKIGRSQYENQILCVYILLWKSHLIEFWLLIAQFALNLKPATTNYYSFSSQTTSFSFRYVLFLLVKAMF